MRKALICAAMFLAAGSISFAGEFGPPEPFDKTLVPSVGYTYSQAEYTSSRPGWEDATITQHGVFLQASLLLSDDSEGYLRIGAADWEVSGFRPERTEYDLRDSANLYTSLGYKRLFYDADWWGLGSFVQGSYYTSQYRDSEDDVRLSVEDLWDVNFGMAAQSKWRPRRGLIDEAILYGGPFYYFASAKAIVDSEDEEGVSYSTNIDEDGNLGGFLGIRVRMPGGMYAGVEGRYKTRFSAGVMLSMFF